MKYEYQLLDNRHSHRHRFKYMIRFPKHHHGTGVLDFDRARRWFTDKYGWSQDVELQGEMAKNRRQHPEAYQPDEINPHWAFLSKYDDYRIYVVSDQEMSFFILSHPNDAA